MLKSRNILLKTFLFGSFFTFYMHAARDYFQNHIILESPSIEHSIDKIKKISNQKPSFVDWKQLSKDGENAFFEIKEMLKDVPDSDLSAVTSYLTTLFDLLINVVESCQLANRYSLVAKIFEKERCRFWTNIRDIDSTVSMPSRYALKKLDWYMENSKTIGGQKTNFSLVCLTFMVKNAFHRGIAIHDLFEELAIAEDLFFCKLPVDGDDSVLNFCGLNDLVQVWKWVAEDILSKKAVISYTSYFNTLVSNIGANPLFTNDRVEKILSQGMSLGRFEHQYKKIESLNISTKEKELKKNEALLCLTRLMDKRNTSDIMQKVGAKIDPIFIDFMIHFFDSGHVTILYLQKVFDVLRERIFAQKNENEVGKDPDCLKIEKYREKAKLLLKFLSKKGNKVDIKCEKKKEKLSEKDLALNKNYVNNSTKGFEKLIKDRDFWNIQNDGKEEGIHPQTSSFWGGLRFLLAPFTAAIRERQVLNSQLKNKSKEESKNKLRHISKTMWGIDGGFNWCGDYNRMIYSPSSYLSLAAIYDFLLVLFPQNTEMSPEETHIYDSIVKQVNKKKSKALKISKCVSPYTHVGIEMLRFACRNKQNGKKLYKMLHVKDISKHQRRELDVHDKKFDNYLLCLCPGFFIQNPSALNLSALIDQQKNVPSREWLFRKCYQMAAQKVDQGLFYAFVPYDKSDEKKIEFDYDNVNLENVGFYTSTCPFGYLSTDEQIKNHVNIELFEDSSKKENELGVKYEKNVQQFTIDEVQDLTNYIADRFRFQLLFVAYESFFKNAIAKNDTISFKAPYFDVLDTMAEKLIKERKQMSENTKLFLQDFDNDTVTLMGYSAEDLIQLMVIRAEFKKAFSTILGHKKKLEELLYPDGYEHERIIKNISEKEKAVRVSLFKVLLGKKDGVDFFKKGENLSADSQNFPPMKNLYKQVFLRLLSYPFIYDDRMFFAILDNIFEKKCTSFFKKNSDSWLYLNRIYDSNSKLLSNSIKEKNDQIHDEWKKLRAVRRALQTSLIKSKKFEGDLFVSQFFTQFHTFILLHRAALEPLYAKKRENIVAHSYLCFSPNSLMVQNFYSLCELVLGDRNEYALNFLREVSGSVWEGNNESEDIVPKSLRKDLKEDMVDDLRKSLIKPFFENFTKKSVAIKQDFHAIIAAIPAPLPFEKKT